jgi:hypothetical protein
MGMPQNPRGTGRAGSKDRGADHLGILKTNRTGPAPRRTGQRNILPARGQVFGNSS